MKYNNVFGLVFLILFFGCKDKESVFNQESGFIEIDHSKLYYQINGTGDTIIILHGGPGLSHRYLKPQLDTLLSADFTLLYYDQRGSGWSEGVDDTTNLNIKTFVEDLEQIRKHFNLDRINLLGHSFGGLLAMYYSVGYPSNVNSLILVDTDAASYELRTPYQTKTINARLSEKQEEFLDSIERTSSFQNFDPAVYEAYYKTFLTTYFADPTDTARLVLGFDSISVPKIGITNKIVRTNLGGYDIHDHLSNIRCSTLIMHGTESIFSVEGATAIHKKIADSKLQLFENCGHFEYIEAPRKFQRLIFDFYKTE